MREDMEVSQMEKKLKRFKTRKNEKMLFELNSTRAKQVLQDFQSLIRCWMTIFHIPVVFKGLR